MVKYFFLLWNSLKNIKKKIATNLIKNKEIPFNTSLVDRLLSTKRNWKNIQKPIDF